VEGKPPAEYRYHDSGSVAPSARKRQIQQRPTAAITCWHGTAPSTARASNHSSMHGLCSLKKSKLQAAHMWKLFRRANAIQWQRQQRPHCRAGTGANPGGLMHQHDSSPATVTAKDVRCIRGVVAVARRGSKSAKRQVKRQNGGHEPTSHTMTPRSERHVACIHATTPDPTQPHPTPTTMQPTFCSPAQRQP
jgi:hypothetical protein